MKAVKIAYALSAFTLLSILSACDSTVTNTELKNFQFSDFSISSWNYSDNHYFVDTLYRRSWKEVYTDSISGFVTQNAIDDAYHHFEVWVQCDVTEPTKRLCVGKVMLGPRPAQGYDTSITNPGNVAGDKFTGYFRKLNESEYNYKIWEGYVAFKNPIPDEYHVGVVYYVYNGPAFGKGFYDSNQNDTLILKLIKVSNPDPVLTPLAWKLKMKNFYRLPFRNIQPTSVIQLQYFANSQFDNYIPGYSTPLITMLKQDKINNLTGNPPPDGKFDWSPGYTIIPEEGYILFRDLEPFSQGLQEAGVTSEYQFGEIYTQRKSQTQMNAKANMFWLKGNAVYY